MTQGEGSYQTSPHAGRPQAAPTFPPPPWPLGPERPLPVTTRTPLLLRIVLTGASVLFLGPAVQGFVDPSAVSVDGEAVSAWAGTLMLLGLALVGIVLLSFAWLNKVVVDRDAVALQVVGIRRSVELTTAERITATPRVVLRHGASAGMLPGRTVAVAVSTTSGGPLVVRADLSEVGPLLEVLTRWWYARPDLVQDQQTAEALASVAARLANRP